MTYIDSLFELIRSKQELTSGNVVSVSLGEIADAWKRENIWEWVKLIFRNFVLLTKKVSFPKILVLEVGADKPGDIRYITTIIKPDIVVLTAFQESPTHGEFFLNIDQHINEKKVLVEKMKKDGIIVYNADDAIMTKMAKERSAKNPSLKLFSYGMNADSNVIILENGNLYTSDAEIMGTKIRFGLNFEHIKDEIEIRLNDVLGEAHAYSIGAAICISVLNAYEKDDLVEVVKTLDFSKSRMRLLDGINNSKIVDDSYNSSPKAAVNAIETVGKILSKGKKIGILGHMAELGKKTEQEHFNIGLLASKTFDILILSGRYNEYYLEGLRAGKFDLSKVFLAKDPEEVLEVIRNNNLIKQSDLVLVKGSQSARLEKVVVELLMNPHDREKVCRQDEEWLKR